MDFFVTAIFSWLRFFIEELLCFWTGYAILMLISFGTSPDTEKLENERKDDGEIAGWSFGSEHNFVKLVGFTFYIIVGGLVLYLRWQK